jgi:hypothetical protein
LLSFERAAYLASANLTLTLQANRQAELDTSGSALARLKFHPARSKLESHPDSLFYEWNFIASSF